MLLTHLKNIGYACTGFKQYRWMRSNILIAALCIAFGVALTTFAQVTQRALPQSESSEIQALMARVGPPSDLALDEFKKAGMENVTQHTLTAPERAKVQALLASLPALHRHVLGRKLHNLAFVDGIPGEGTGLTSANAKTGLYDITLRASILDESLSQFLTTKEHRVFTTEGSGITVEVKGTGTDAVTYVLLHESTHVVDQSCNITSEPHNRFVEGIWMEPHTLVPKLASSTAGTTYFHHGRPLAFSQAATVYDSLAQSPFVSLYSTASEQEDFAELVAWREVMQQHGGNLIIEMADADGKILRRWEPLTFPGVQKRFADVDDLLASKGYCGTSS
jgi:hypothetical protein